jgi:ethanolamine utilization protein EutQ (cupin superfamily)
LLNLIINNNNESSASSGVLIEDGDNIDVKYLSSQNTTYPITVKSDATNVTIEGVLRSDIDGTSVIYNIETGSDATIIEQPFYTTY